jgi:hypothetical protein
VAADAALVLRCRRAGWLQRPAAAIVAAVDARPLAQQQQRDLLSSACASRAAVMNAAVRRLIGRAAATAEAARLVNAANVAVEEGRTGRTSRLRSIGNRGRILYVESRAHV